MMMKIGGHRKLIPFGCSRFIAYLGFCLSMGLANAAAIDTQLDIGGKQIYSQGDALQVKIGVTNSSTLTPVDAYVGIIDPNGVVIFYEYRNDTGIPHFAGPDPLTYTKLASNLPIPASLNSGLIPVVNYTFNGSEPFGQYQVFFVLTQAGTFNFLSYKILTFKFGGLAIGRVKHNGNPTTWGYASIDFKTTVLQRKYMNIVVDLNGDGAWGRYNANGTTQEEWIVRNMVTLITPDESNNYTFVLNDPVADTRTGLKARALITDTPINTAGFPNGWDGTLPATLFSTKDFTLAGIGVEDMTLNVANPDFMGFSGAQNRSAAVTPNPLLILPELRKQQSLQIASRCQSTANSVEHWGVPNIKQKDNSCVPTTVTNNLYWLAQEFNFTGQLPASMEDARAELKRDMNWNEAAGGVNEAGFLTGKNAFMERHKLRISTHEIGTADDPDLLDKIMAELKKCQAVEIKIDFFKCVGPSPCTWQKSRSHMVAAMGQWTDSGNTKFGFKDSQTGFSAKPPKAHIDFYEINKAGAPDIPNSKNEILGYPLLEAGEFATIAKAWAQSPIPSHTLTPQTESITHTIGQTACPTPLGAVTITNTGYTNLNWTVGNNMPFIALDQTSGSIPPGGSVSVQPRFNCSNYQNGTNSGALRFNIQDPLSASASAGPTDVTISVKVQ